MSGGRAAGQAIPPSLEGTDLLVLGAASLATPLGSAALPLGAVQLRVLGRPVVACRRGVIVHVGPESELPASLLADPLVLKLDAAGGTLLPGLVDCHTHAAHAGWREDEMRLRLSGASYSDIAHAGGGIASTVRATRAATDSQLLRGLLDRLQRMMLAGTTTAEVKSGYGLDTATEIRLLETIREAARLQPVDLVPTFLGAHSVPPEFRGRRDEYVSLVTDEMLPAVASQGLASACDVFCEEGVFTVDDSRRILLRARELGLQLKVHADELATTGGAELAAELGALSAEHLMRASDAGLEAMARRGVVAVLLPTTSLFLMEPYLPAERLRRAGCAVAVATDCNPGTSPTESLPLAAMLACVGNRLLPDEALAAVTLNAAAALGMAGVTGSLEVGKRADLVVLDAPNALHLVYRFGGSLVRHVVQAGRVVVRDGAPA